MRFSAIDAIVYVRNLSTLFATKLSNARPLSSTIPISEVVLYLGKNKYRFLCASMELFKKNTKNTIYDCSEFVVNFV